MRHLLLRILPLACAACLLGGCHASGRVGQALPKDLSGSDPDSQINFWHSLADQPVTSNDAAFHGLMLYLNNQDDAADYAGRVANLKSRGMLPNSFYQPPEMAVQRGTLAMALVRALDIKGGVTLRAFGGQSPRYAKRELQFMGLYPPGSANQTFSGNEYVGIIGRIEDYQRGDAANKPATELPGERQQAASK